MFNVLSLLLIMCGTTGVIAQTQADFYGKWKVTNGNESENQWTFIRPDEDHSSYSWGKYFDFHEDGTYTEYASAPCGLDDNHYTYSGNWRFDPSTKRIELSSIKIINDRPGIYQNYKVLTSGSMEVLMFKGDTLQLRIVNYWEQVSRKN